MYYKPENLSLENLRIKPNLASFRLPPLGTPALSQQALSAKSLVVKWPKTPKNIEFGVKGLDPQVETTVWFLVGNGRMDSRSCPYIIPNKSPHNPFPHSLPRTRQSTKNPKPL